MAAGSVPPPPAYTGQSVPRVENRDTPKQAAPAPVDDVARLEPNEEDMRRARARLRHDAETRHAQPEPFVGRYGTRIEEHHDQNDHLTEVRVTPGETQIPYTMRNRSDRPIDNRPGADSRSTLDTPKFIHFGW